jgi:hypothetical protein
LKLTLRKSRIVGRGEFISDVAKFFHGWVSMGSEGEKGSKRERKRGREREVVSPSAISMALHPANVQDARGIQTWPFSSTLRVTMYT